MIVLVVLRGERKGDKVDYFIVFVWEGLRYYADVVGDYWLKMAVKV